MPEIKKSEQEDVYKFIRQWGRVSIQLLHKKFDFIQHHDLEQIVAELEAGGSVVRDGGGIVRVWGRKYASADPN